MGSAATRFATQRGPVTTSATLPIMRVYPADVITVCSHGFSLLCMQLPVAVATRVATGLPGSGMATTVIAAVGLWVLLRLIVAPRIPRLHAWFRLRRALGRYQHDAALGVDGRVLLFVHRRPARGVTRICLDEDLVSAIHSDGIGVADTIWTMDFGLIVRRKDGFRAVLDGNHGYVRFIRPPLPPLDRRTRWESIGMAIRSGTALPTGPELEILLDQLDRAEPLSMPG